MKRIHLPDNEVLAFQKDNPHYFEGVMRGEKDAGISKTIGGIGIHSTIPMSGVESDVLAIVPRSYAAPLELGYEGGLSGLESARDQVIANVTGMRVIGVDTPGFGLNESSSATLHEITSAIGGSMRPHARRQLAAVAEFLSYREDISYDSLRLIGYSMGGFSVSGMLTVLPEVMPKAKVSEMTFIETANDQNRKLTRILNDDGLLAQINRETNEANTNRYLSMNYKGGFKNSFDRNDSDPELSINTQRQAMLKAAEGRAFISNPALGIGLTRGFASVLERWYQQPGKEGVPTTFVRADGSEIGRETANKHTVAMLQQYTNAELFSIDDNEHPHHHPLWQSLGLVAYMMHTLSKGAPSV